MAACNVLDNRAFTVICFIVILSADTQTSCLLGRQAHIYERMVEGCKHDYHACCPGPSGMSKLILTILAKASSLKNWASSCGNVNVFVNVTIKINGKMIKMVRQGNGTSLGNWHKLVLRSVWATNLRLHSHFKQLSTWLKNVLGCSRACTGMLQHEWIFQGTSLKVEVSQVYPQFFCVFISLEWNKGQIQGWIYPWSIC